MTKESESDLAQAASVFLPIFAIVFGLMVYRVFMIPAIEADAKASQEISPELKRELDAYAKADEERSANREIAEMEIIVADCQRSIATNRLVIIDLYRILRPEYQQEQTERTAIEKSIYALEESIGNLQWIMHDAKHAIKASQDELTRLNQLPR